MTDTLHLLSDYYPRAFPDRSGAAIHDVIDLNTGWESEVHSFSVDWVQDGLPCSEDLILRIYPGQDAFSKAKKEYEALELLHRAGYPVPRVDRLELDPAPFGKPFLIMERIHGQPMWKPMFHGSWFKQHALRVKFCSLFSRLHTLDWRALVPDPEKHMPSAPNRLVEEYLLRLKPLIQAVPIPGFQTNWDWLDANCKDVPSAGPVLVHWDFHPENILLKENGEAVVIDWTGLELTDYRFDLAWTLLLLSAAEGSRHREPLLREYERQAGHRVQDMEVFDTFACLRRLFSIIVSLKYGADKLGMRPGAEAIMRRQAPAARRVYERLLTLTDLTIPEVEQFLNSSEAS
ncbi:MAG: hypothetical protein EHM21_09620 [Chloroflexi bacterium]|nr:MAG: hypothetical protein EHM21_09620 [Chloroflexota bacterium]